MEPNSELDLTEDEQKAKDFMLHLLVDGTSIECDKEASDIKLELPKWYDEVKFKRGQKYYADNKFGLLNASMFGLLAAISDPKGVQILDGTGQSSTTETSKKRYVQTIMHNLSWYESELAPGSKSWKSLEQVRKMHYHASKQSIKKGLGHISITEVSLTAYGFMGFGITRPHLLGMTYDNREDREGFIFLWAVLLSLLGVPDEFNMCLHSFEVVFLICELTRRYAFMQILQLDTPLTIQLGKAFIDGQKDFLPMLSYESVMFMTKRIAGIPGYQYDVDLSKETLVKSVFTLEEMKQIQANYGLEGKNDFLKKFVIDGKFFLLKVRRGDANNNNNNNTEKYTSSEDATNAKNNIDLLHKVMGLKETDDLSVITVEDSDFSKHLNDSEFHKLSTTDQINIRLRVMANRNNYKWWGRWMHSRMIKSSFKKMEQYLEGLKAKTSP